MANRTAALLQSLFFRGLKVEPKAAWHDAYADLGEIAAFAVERDGGTLRCVRVKARPDVAHKRIAILAHPISRKAKYYFTEGGRIEGYLHRGCDVVCFDFNGFGESERIDMRYWCDAKAIIEHVARTDEGCRIIVHGLSFGAFHSIRSIQALPPRSAAVFENVSRSVLDYWRRWLTTRILVYILQSMRLRAVREMNVMQFLRAFDRHDVKLLFIGCSDDDITPVSEMRDLFGCAPEPKRLVVIDGVGHYGAPHGDPSRYWQAIEHVLAD